MINLGAFKRAIPVSLLCSIVSCGLLAEEVGLSPWGSSDEIGRLNMMTAETQSAILAQISASSNYDLGVELYVGMPSWQAGGEPPYQIWMTQTPHGRLVDNPRGLAREHLEHISKTGSVVSFYTHTGTHIDFFGHFGLNGKVWNGFESENTLGDRGWHVVGVENIPPIIARGVLVDVAGMKQMQSLPDGYRVSREDLIASLRLQNTEVQSGDVVLIRTGRMNQFHNAQAYMANSPGISLSAVKFLVEERDVMIIGSDNISFEAFPSGVAGNPVPVHTYLLAEKGVPILEVVNLEELASNKVYEFAFIGTPIKLRGADAAPIRPIALPLKKE